MKIKHYEAISASQMAKMNTEALREKFLISNLFKPNEANFAYLDDDRIIIGGVVPLTSSLEVKIDKAIGAKFFLERRELGIINIGGKGYVEHDQGKEVLANEDGLYLPVGNQKIVFHSENENKPAKFYLFSTQGLITYPITKVNIKNAQPLKLGNIEQSNIRTIYQYFHPNVCQTNTLLMGLTKLEVNNIWNTMPAHLHLARTECYLYLNIAPEEVVFHFMGQKDQTRHLILKNEDFVLSPPWSIHSGVGTKNYAFIWAMGGSNIDYRDMEIIEKNELK